MKEQGLERHQGLGDFRGVDVQPHDGLVLELDDELIRFEGTNQYDGLHARENPMHQAEVFVPSEIR